MKSEHLLPAGVIFSICLSFFAIYTAYPRSHGLDYIGIIFTAMTVLVAILIGFQVLQYIFAESKMEKIAKEETQKITESLTEDFKHILMASTFLSQARNYKTFCIPHKSIHHYLLALQEYLDIKDSKLHDSCPIFLFEELLPIAQNWKSKNELAIWEDQRQNYQDLLDNFDIPMSRELKELLSTAKKAEGQKDYVGHISV